MTPVSVAILDDFQDVTRAMADWDRLPPHVSVTIFNEHFEGEELIRRISRFDILVITRERILRSTIREEEEDDIATVQLDFAGGEIDRRYGRYGTVDIDPRRVATFPGTVEDVELDCNAVRNSTISELAAPPAQSGDAVVLKDKGKSVGPGVE